MKMASIVILVTPFLVLVGTAIAVTAEQGKARISNPGAHGFSEILYALSSAANNNGSAFAGSFGQHAVLQFAAWHWSCGSADSGFIVPVLAIAGSLRQEKAHRPTAGTLPTHGPLFVVCWSAPSCWSAR